MSHCVYMPFDSEIGDLQRFTQTGSVHPTSPHGGVNQSCEKKGTHTNLPLEHQDCKALIKSTHTVKSTCMHRIYISLKLSHSWFLSQCYLLCTFVTNEKTNSNARISTCPLGKCVYVYVCVLVNVFMRTQCWRGTMTGPSEQQKSQQNRLG